MLHTSLSLSTLIFASVLCTACLDDPVFVTDAGIGPDKWGSIWLIRRHIDRTADVFVKNEGVVDGAIIFDTDDAELRRTADSTTYEKLLARYEITDETALRVGRIVRDMEINSWGEKAIEYSKVFESRYRQLQQHFGRESIPEQCYLSFFDTLSRSLESSRSAAELDNALSNLPCDTSKKLKSPETITELPVMNVLEQLRLGRKVVFIDTREQLEFAEYHIPGAIRHPLREIDGELAAMLSSADLVIPYCVKDFRGYEAARRLQALGVHQVAIMNPYGVKGWRQAGLPVVLPEGPNDGEAYEALIACAEQPNSCLTVETRPSSS